MLGFVNGLEVTEMKFSVCVCIYSDPKKYLDTKAMLRIYEFYEINQITYFFEMLINAD